MSEPTASPPPQPVPAPGHGAWRWVIAVAVLLCALCAAALALVWNTQQRVRELEQQLVKRQQDSGAQAAEAQMLARQAQDTARDAAARLALLDARVADASAQRAQIDDLMQSLSHSREESALADIETALRLAMQQSSITGSAEPLVVVLKQIDERLQRHPQPALDSVHRAVQQDLDRVRSASLPDIAALAARIDEVIRQVDDLPLISAPQRRSRTPPPVRRAASQPARAGSAAAPSAAASQPLPTANWREQLEYTGGQYLARLWDEVRSLIRVTPIEHPEAMLVAPDQALMLRANLKLRLLNARLALLSRQFELAQADLLDAQATLQRYFEHDSRRVAEALAMLQQVGAQAHQVRVPRPDASLAAIDAASVRR